MTLSDAVFEYLAVLDTPGGYSTKRLANALDAVREAHAPSPTSAVDALSETAADRVAHLKQDMQRAVGAVPYAAAAKKPAKPKPKPKEAKSS